MRAEDRRDLRNENFALRKIGKRLLMQGFGFFLNARMQDGEFFLGRTFRQPFE